MVLGDVMVWGAGQSSQCEEVTLHGVGGGGSVVTGPSHSPENAFKLPDGKFAHLGELPLPAPAGARVLRGVSE
eukprot:1055376-Rhodomonas_salina.1